MLFQSQFEALAGVAGAPVDYVKVRAAVELRHATPKSTTLIDH